MLLMRGWLRVGQGGATGAGVWVSLAAMQHHRLTEPLVYLPRAEFEAHYHRQRAGQTTVIV